MAAGAESVPAVAPSTTTNFERAGRMSKRSVLSTCARATAIAIALLTLVNDARAATVTVPAGGDLQAALDAARPGDTILLVPGVTYVGNFVLPVHGGTSYVTIRTAGNDSNLPAAGVRITPAHAAYLAALRSPSPTATPWLPALRTAPGAAYWRVMLLEFLANMDGDGDIVGIGDGSSAQSLLSQVPHHITLGRFRQQLYVDRRERANQIKCAGERPY